MLPSPVPREYKAKSKRSPIPTKIVITPAARLVGTRGVNLRGDSQIYLLHKYKDIKASTWIPLEK